jgi:transcriptional regulator with XRE-family HTH domain
MNLFERESLDKFSRVLRAGRKLKNLSQVDMAKELGVSQGQISKIEKAQMVPSAPAWFRICEILELPVHSGAVGYIDTQKVAVVLEKISAQPFKIPEKYSYLTGSMSRTAQPMLQYFTSCFGADKTNAFLKQLKIDPDFFTVLDQSLNINFNLDLARMLINKGKITPDNVSALRRHIGKSMIHGALAGKFEQSKDAVSLLRTLSANMVKYDANWKYEFNFEKKNLINIEAIPREHLSDFSYEDDNLGAFVQQYQKTMFEQFLNDHHYVPEKVISFKSKNKMSKACIYQIHL